jgi:hypothetical protein
MTAPHETAETVEVIGAAPEPAADPAMAALMSALSGTSQLDPLAMLYSQIGASNPQAAMVLQLLEQRRAQANTVIEQEDVADADGEHDARETHEPHEPEVSIREQDLRTLQETVENACAELETLRTRSDAIARAIGACYLCYGEDAQCAECGGRGKPGSLVPEPAAFRQYVLPALRRAQAVQAHRKQFHGVRPDRPQGPSPHSSQQPAPDR